MCLMFVLSSGPAILALRHTSGTEGCVPVCQVGPWLYLAIIQQHDMPLYSRWHACSYTVRPVCQRAGLMDLHN